MRHWLAFVIILFFLYNGTLTLLFGIHESDRKHKKWNKNNKKIHLGKMKFMFFNHPKTSKEMSKFPFIINILLYSYVFLTIIIAGVFAFIIPNMDILTYCAYSLIIMPIGLILISVTDDRRFYSEKQREIEDKIRGKYINRKLKVKWNYLKRINEGLLVNKHFIIKWNDTPEQLSKLFKNNAKKISNNYYTISVTLFNDRFIGEMGVHYSSEGKIAKIELYKEQDDDLQNTFLVHQKILEDYFKQPSEVLILETNRGEKEYKWHFKYVTLVHSLSNKFNFEERIEFIVR